MSDGGRYSALEGIGAIHLAVEAAADDRTRVKVLREILKRVPEPSKADSAPVGLLIDAIRASKTELRVTDYEPRGRIARQRRGAVR